MSEIKNNPEIEIEVVEKVYCRECKHGYDEMYPEFRGEGLAIQGDGICASIVERDGEKYISAGYGSCFDSEGASGNWYFEAEHSNDFQIGGPVCDECIKTWINEHKMYQKTRDRACLLCHERPQSYKDIDSQISICQMEDKSEMVYCFRSVSKIRVMSEKDAEIWKIQGLGHHSWLCQACFITVEKQETKLGLSRPLIFNYKACGLCDKDFERNSIWNMTCFDHDHFLHIGFSMFHGNYTLNPDLTIRQAQKYLTLNKAACPECVEKLIQEKILILKKQDGRLSIE